MIQICAIAIIAISFKMIKAVFPYIGRSYVPRSDKYVIINGCTDGIGKQFAIHLSTHNIPLILIGRNSYKLANLKNELSGVHQFLSQAHIKILNIDYAEDKLNQDNFIQQLENLGLKSQSISGFINCCGQAFVDKYSQYPFANIQTIKRVNTCSLDLALKTMTSHLISDSSFIINLSSHTAHFPLKYSSVYSATKAYSSNLFAAFSQENPHIKSLLVEPWYVTTKMTGNRKTWDCVTPQQIVKGCFKAINYRRKCAGTIKHEIIYQFKYLLQKYYNWTVLQQNYQRVLKLKQLKAKRINNQAKVPKQKDKDIKQ